MEHLSNKPAAVVLIAGSILFLIAAFLPYSRVFSEADPAVRLEILQQRRTQWVVGQVFFILGSVATTIGLTLLYLRFRESAQGNWPWIGLVIVLIGSLLWSWHCIERMISPEGFVNGTLTPYLFLIYSLFTQAGLIILGIFLLGTGLPGWTGWMLIGGMASLFILMIIFKDMPPFAYYLFTLVLAIKLLAEMKGVVAA